MSVKLSNQGVHVSQNAVWLFLRREGLSFKKSLFAIEQGRPDVKRRRKRWKEMMVKLDPQKLVFIDETWIKTSMAPLRGGGQRGKRLKAYAPHGHWTPHGHWKTMTFVGALRYNQLTAPCVFDGPINGDCFKACVSQVLLSTLKRGVRAAAMLGTCGPWSKAETNAA